MKVQIIIAAIAITVAAGIAQTQETKSSNQPPEWPQHTAEVFAPGVVSSSTDEYGLAVTRDWSEIYFSRNHNDSSSIMVSKWTNRGWSTPKVASFSGQGIDGHPWLTSDGKSLMFVSRRPCAGASQALNVWMANRSGEAWDDARPLGPPFTVQTVHAPSISASGTVYATGVKRFRNIGGVYQSAENLNIKGSHPAIAADESFIVFSARAQNSNTGKDLHVAFADPQGGWTAPRRLGSAVNGRANESSPTLSADGKVLFFSRGGDIWWIDASIIGQAASDTTRQTSGN